MSRGRYKKLPDCAYNSMIQCEESGRKCTSCGWNPKEIKRRKAEIHEQRLNVSPTFKRFFSLKKGDAE